MNTRTGVCAGFAVGLFFAILAFHSKVPASSLQYQPLAHFRRPKAGCWRFHFTDRAAGSALASPALTAMIAATLPKAEALCVLAPLRERFAIARYTANCRST